MALANIYPATLTGAKYEEAYLSTEAAFSQFLPGDVSIDNQGGQWVYAQSSESIAAYQLCKLSTAATTLAQPVAAADIDALVPLLAIPQVAVASGSRGWFWRGPGGGVGRGIKVLAATLCVTDVLLCATATDGVVDDTIVTDDVIAGLTICATIVAAAAAECRATVPLSCNLDEGIA